MAYESFLDAAGATKYRKTTGASSTGDPSVLHNIIDSGTITTVSTVTGVTTVSTVNSVTALGTITPGTAATSLGKAEDAAHSSGDVGVMGLAVRNDAGTTLAGTDGDYAPLSVNSAGALYVTGGGGGTEYTEDAAAAANPVGGAQILVRADTPGTVTTTDGDNVAQRGTNYGAAYVQLVTSSGSFIDSVGGGTQYAVDAALGSTPTGTLAVAIRDDALSALTPVEGDAIGLRVDANGALWVGVSGTVSATQSGTWNIGTVTTVSTVTNLSQLGGQAISMGTGVRAAGTQRVTIATDDVVPVTGTFWQATQPISGTVTATITAGASTIAKAEDVASADGDVGVPFLAVRKATPANTSGTDGDYEFAQISAGRLWTSATIDAALPAGTNAIGKLAANSGVDIGDVDVTSAVISSGTLTTCSTVTTLSTLTGGGVAHDGADSGNPVKVGARAVSTLATATMVAAADRTDNVSDLDSSILVRPQCPLGDLKRTTQSVTATTSTAATNFGAVASTKNYITSVTVWNSSAVALFVRLQDGSGGSDFWVFPAPAGGGVTHNFDPPLPQPTANTALYFAESTTASTVYVSILGFQSKC